MRVAFYAPMKPDDHPVPSGDRRIARLLREALRIGGHEPITACRLRTWQRAPDRARQARLRALSTRAGALLCRRWRDPAWRPRAWMTYHSYYKAPDWLGPSVSRALDMPYAVVEASVAPKRADGPWADGHQATVEGLGQARLAIGLNPTDEAMVSPHLGGRYVPLPPFLDTAPYRDAAAARAAHRRVLAARLDLDPALTWVLVVGMMRPGDKAESYARVAETARRLDSRAGELAFLVVGDGVAGQQVRARLREAWPGAVHFLGRLSEEDLVPCYAAADLMLWPAVGEAFGMALLEAQAAGLPVVAGDFGGVGAIVRHGRTGLLAPDGAPEVLASAVARLVDAPEDRDGFRAAALSNTRSAHDLGAAARTLSTLMREIAS